MKVLFSDSLRTQFSRANVFKVSTMILAGVFSTAITAQPEPNGDESNMGVGPNADYTIDIDFEEGCPADSNKSIRAVVGNGKTLQFVSSPAGLDFTITFDPFVGKRYAAKNGKTNILHLNPRSLPYDTVGDNLTFDFKFTIYAEGCTPIDPRVIVTT